MQIIYKNKRKSVAIDIAVCYNVLDVINARLKMT